MTTPTRQYKIALLTPDSDVARTMTGVLGELVEPTADAVTQFEHGGGWKVEAYYTGQPDTGRIARGLAEALGAHMPAPLAELLPDENWVAMSQAALPPVSAGRFTIHGSHDRGRVARGPNAVEIDAGEAFGTAHHATTLCCLMAIDRIAAQGGNRRMAVLDLGCGSGVLAIAAARALPHARVLATDIDPQAVAVARANVALNAAAAHVATMQADGLDHPRLRGAQFDLVIANILAGPLVDLARGISRITPTGAIVVLSGLLVPQAPKVVAAYTAAGFVLAGHQRLAGWSTLTLVRRPRGPSRTSA